MWLSDVEKTVPWKDERVSPKEAGGLCLPADPFFPRSVSQGDGGSVIVHSSNHISGPREELTDYREQETLHPVPNVSGADVECPWGAVESKGTHN